jgi:hypothetical protein
MDEANSGTARQTLGRIEERATEAAANSRAAREEIVALARELSGLTASLKAMNDQMQSHFADDRRHFDDYGPRLATLEKSDAATRATNSANRWWVTVIATIGGAVAGGLAGNFRIFGGH